VKEGKGNHLTINWRYFSLEQVNSQQEEGWKIWGQPDDYPSRGLPAFRAAQAARNQGEATFDRFHHALLRARHEQRQDIADRNTLLETAQDASLDIARFEKDLNDRRLLDRIAQDHTTAVETMGIFGTPTLVFAEKQAVFLKLSSPPPAEESLAAFNELSHLAGQRRYIQEVKRP